MRKEKLIILGAQGFISINLIKYLKNSDHNIFGIGNKTEYFKKIIKINKSHNLKIIQENVFNIKKIAKYFTKGSQVIFLAGTHHQKPKFLINFRKLIYLCKENKIDKFILISSAAVYGNNNSINSEEIKTNPINPHGKFFLKLEKSIKKIFKNSEINYIILRAFNVFGAYRKRPGVIEKMILNNLNKENFSFFRPDIIRSYLSATDLVQVIYYNLKYTKKNEIFNVSNPNYIFSFKLLSKKMNRYFKRRNYYTYMNINKNFIKKSVCYPKKLINKTGFKFKSNFSKEIKNIVNYYKSPIYES